MSVDQPVRDLRAFLDLLRARGELVEVETAVDPCLEIAEIHRRVIAAGGPALLFRNPSGADFPVVTNLFGTYERVLLSFGQRPRRFVERVVEAAQELVPPTAGKLWGFRDVLLQGLKVGMKNRSRGPVTEVSEVPALDRLPALTSWHSDPEPLRGGRARRNFQVDPAGLTALSRSRKVMEKMWDGVVIDSEAEAQ